MALDEAVEMVIKEYGLKQRVRDKRPKSLRIVGDGKGFTLMYSKELPFDGFLGEELQQLVKDGNREERGSYFEHGPYYEFLGLESRNIKLVADYQVGKQGEILSQSLRLDIPSLQTDAWLSYLRQSSDIVAKRFCREWDNRTTDSSAHRENLVHCQEVCYTSNSELLNFMRVILEKNKVMHYQNHSL